MKLIKEVRKLYENSLKNNDQQYEELKQEIINQIKETAIKSRTSLEYKIEDTQIEIVDRIISYFKKEGFKVEHFELRTFGNIIAISW